MFLEVINRTSMEEARYFQNLLTQDSCHEDEVIDTLSLSDLLIYDYNGDHPQDFYQLNDQNPNLEVDDQSFEFSTELLKTPGGSNVVFCGKIIPYKEPNVFQTTPNLESKKVQKSNKKRWSFVRFFKKSSKPTSNMDSEKVDLKYEVPIRRVSILASATKPRWYLLLFGFGSSSFSAQMHIKDLKKRKTSTGTKNSKDNKINGGGIGSWSLATLLGCGGGGGGGGSKHHRNAIIKIE